MDQNAHIANVVRHLVEQHRDCGEYAEMRSHGITSGNGHAVDEAVNGRSEEEICHHRPVASRRSVFAGVRDWMQIEAAVMMVGAVAPNAEKLFQYEKGEETSNQEA
jgi:hypothetical protein